jgi:cell division protein FtsB
MRRPAPRRNAGQDAGRVQWDKLGRIVLVAAVFGLCLLYVGPIYNLVTTYRETGAVKEEFHRVQDENERLRSIAEQARSDAVLRREARRQGMVIPGEQAYVVSGLNR